MHTALITRESTFYGKKCPLAKCGKDKEGVKGRPLIRIGLGVTKQKGVPVVHKVYEGNIHDSRTQPVQEPGAATENRLLCRCPSVLPRPYSIEDVSGKLVMFLIEQQRKDLRESRYDEIHNAQKLLQQGKTIKQGLEHLQALSKGGCENGRIWIMI